MSGIIPTILGDSQGGSSSKGFGFFPKYPTKGYPANQGLLTIIAPSYSPNKALFFGGGGGGNFCDTDKSSKSHCQGMGSDGPGFNHPTYDVSKIVSYVSLSLQVLVPNCFFSKDHG